MKETDERRHCPDWRFNAEMDGHPGGDFPLAETTMPPSRALVLNVMLSLLVSAAVFVVVSQIVLVPQMARQQAEIVVLQAQVNELQAAVAAETSAAVTKVGTKTVTAGAQAGAPAAATSAGAQAAPAIAPAKRGAVPAIAK